MNQQAIVARQQSKMPQEIESVMQAMEVELDGLLKEADISPERFKASFAIAGSAQNKTGALIRAASAYEKTKAIVTAASLGVTVTGDNGNAYLVPYKDREGNVTISVIVSYEEMIKKADKTGYTIYTDLIYEGEEYELPIRAGDKMIHRRTLDRKGKKILGVWAQAIHRDGRVTECAFLGRREIDEVKGGAKTQKIWNAQYEAMAKKTAIRRLYKLIPFHESGGTHATQAALMGTHQTLIEDANKDAHIEVTDAGMRVVHDEGDEPPPPTTASIAQEVNGDEKVQEVVKAINKALSGEGEILVIVPGMTKNHDADTVAHALIIVKNAPLACDVFSVMEKGGNIDTAAAILASITMRDKHFAAQFSGRVSDDLRGLAIKKVRELKERGGQ